MLSLNQVEQERLIVGMTCPNKGQADLIHLPLIHQPCHRLDSCVNTFVTDQLASIEQFQMPRLIISFANVRESFYICTAIDDTGMLDRQACLKEKIADPSTHTNHMLEF